MEDLEVFGCAWKCLEWSAAGVGVGMLRGKGFLGFLVSKFLGFKVVWLLGYDVSKIYQIRISCLLEDIEPISKIFKILLDGSAGLFGARLFQN